MRKINYYLRLILNYQLGFYYLKIKFGFPNVLTLKESIDVIVNSNSSVCRFGDGEFSLINGIGNGFQNENKYLATRLKAILIDKNESCLVAIPGVFTVSNKMKFMPSLVWRTLLHNFYSNIYLLLDTNRTYTNSLVTRPYVDFSDKGLSSYIFDSFKTLWANKRVLIVEGKGTKFGVGNYLFKNTKLINRVLCPDRNAFDWYDEICGVVRKYKSDFDLVLVALGPTATVLVSDLSKEGMRLIDIGHLDIEYEWFLAQASKKILVEGKNINELGVNGANNYAENSFLKEYEKQVLEVIGK
jgi:glycosyltransferase family protein